MRNCEPPYIRAVESPQIRLNPTSMRDIVFKRHISIDSSVNLDDQEVLKALCSTHFEKCNGMIDESRIERYELHLKDDDSEHHNIFRICI